MSLKEIFASKLPGLEFYEQPMVIMNVAGPIILLLMRIYILPVMVLKR